MSYDNLCAICEKVATKKCSACPEGVLYCGAKHQKVHWHIHKNHHGKDEGRFIYPRLNQVEAEEFFSMFFEAVDSLRRNKTERAKFLVEVAETFSPTMAQIIVNIKLRDAIPEMIPHFAKMFKTENDKLDITDQIVNSNSIKRQIFSFCLTLVDYDLQGDGIYYAVYASLPLLQLEDTLNQSESLMSSYYFRVLNFRFATISNEFEQSAHSYESRRNLWDRVLAEVERMKIEGSYKLISAMHELLAKNVDSSFDQELWADE